VHSTDPAELDATVAEAGVAPGSACMPLTPLAEEMAACLATFRTHNDPVAFRKMFGPVLVQPLGLQWDQLSLALTNDGTVDEFVTEDLAQAQTRIAAVNRSGPCPLGQTFETLAYALEDDRGYETIVGPLAADSQIDPKSLLKHTARQCGVQVETLSPAVVEEFERVRVAWRDAKELARREFWSCLYPTVARKLMQGEYEDNILVLYSYIGADRRARQFRLVRRGDDALVDELVDAARALHDRVRRDVAGATR
jgi:hypothetical protein